MLILTMRLTIGDKSDSKTVYSCEDGTFQEHTWELKDSGNNNADYIVKTILSGTRQSESFTTLTIDSDSKIIYYKLEGRVIAEDISYTFEGDISSNKPNVSITTQSSSNSSSSNISSSSSSSSNDVTDSCKEDILTTMSLGNYGLYNDIQGNRLFETSVCNEISNIYTVYNSCTSQLEFGQDPSIKTCDVKKVYLEQDIEEGIYYAYPEATLGTEQYLKDNTYGTYYETPSGCTFSTVGLNDENIYLNSSGSSGTLYQKDNNGLSINFCFVIGFFQ